MKIRNTAGPHRSVGGASASSTIASAKGRAGAPLGPTLAPTGKASETSLFLFDVDPALSEFGKWQAFRYAAGLLSDAPQSVLLVVSQGGVPVHNSPAPASQAALASGFQAVLRQQRERRPGWLPALARFGTVCRSVGGPAVAVLGTDLDLREVPPLAHVTLFRAASGLSKNEETVLHLVGTEKINLGWIDGSVKRVLGSRLRVSYNRGDGFGENVGR